MTRLERGRCRYNKIRRAGRNEIPSWSTLCADARRGVFLIEMSARRMLRRFPRVRALGRGLTDAATSAGYLLYVFDPTLPEDIAPYTRPEAVRAFQKAWNDDRPRRGAQLHTDGILGLRTCEALIEVFADAGGSRDFNVSIDDLLALVRAAK